MERKGLKRVMLLGFILIYLMGICMFLSYYIWFGIRGRSMFVFLILRRIR